VSQGIEPLGAKLQDNAGLLDFRKSAFSFIFGVPELVPKKSRFSSHFTYENEGLAGAGIEPATRGFSVHCSAN
jgi:hypothetical protein